MGFVLVATVGERLERVGKKENKRVKGQDATRAPELLTVMLFSSAGTQMYDGRLTEYYNLSRDKSSHTVYCCSAAVNQDASGSDSVPFM